MGISNFGVSKLTSREMSDPPLHLGFAEAPVLFESPSQRARVWTEQWAAAHLFCPNCGSQNVTPYKNNRPVADFGCPRCNEEYELKSQKNQFGRKVNDGAFETMCERLASDNNPNLVLRTMISGACR